MKKKCLNCGKVFETNNKQKLNCTEKCRSAKGWEAHKKRKQKKKTESEKYFRFEDYGGNLLI